MDFRPIQLKTVFPPKKARSFARPAADEEATPATAASEAALGVSDTITVTTSAAPTFSESRPTLRTAAKRPPHTWVYAAIAGDWAVAVLAAVAHVVTGIPPSDRR